MSMIARDFHIGGVGRGWVDYVQWSGSTEGPPSAWEGCGVTIWGSCQVQKYLPLRKESRPFRPHWCFTSTL
jgi:hypothetical protein